MIDVVSKELDRLNTTIRRLKIDLDFERTKRKDLAHQLQQALEENERYKEEIMTLRQGYDEESCIETCPHSQKQEQEIEQLQQKLEKIKDQMLKDIEVFKNGRYDTGDFIIDLRDYIRFIEGEE